MPRHITVQVDHFPIAGTFRISRGAKTEAVVIVCSIEENGKTGRGECVPYARYGETVASVLAQIDAMRGSLAEGIDREELSRQWPAGAARNAVDCALWDLEAKSSGRRVAEMIGNPSPRPVVTAQTISLGTPEEMAAQARRHSDRPLLKFKVGLPEGDAERIKAVREAAPASKLILDANEGWTEDNLEENLAMAERFGVSLVEQPLPAGKDEMLGRVPRRVPVCADESVHTRAGLAQLVGLYDAINIKLDKTGGLTEAMKLKTEAENLGFSIMAGCMVGTSLSMAPAVLLAQDASFVDLDGPLLLARDREPGLTYDAAAVHPPTSELWG